MPVKEKDKEECCLVDAEHLRELVGKLSFPNESSQYVGCMFCNPVDATEEDSFYELERYIRAFGSDQHFRDLRYDVNERGKSVTCGEYIYFKILGLGYDSALIYRGKLDEVDYDYTGTPSIIFKKDGA